MKPLCTLHAPCRDGDALREHLRRFKYDESGESGGAETRVDLARMEGVEVPVFSNEFWTSRQRRASSIHEVSYRGCFKPQLPRFFIHLLTRPGDAVYDPFSGRGTTALEAALLERIPIANDANPLHRILCVPRLAPPSLAAVADRLERVSVRRDLDAGIDLTMFYHPDTLPEILSLRAFLAERSRGGEEDDIDRWIRMVATNRLTGHSTGFFSVYTLPPNQAASSTAQKRINERRGQAPSYRDTRALILRKTASLLRTVSEEDTRRLRNAGERALFLTGDARHVPEIAGGSVALTVTSPPFLDVVQYSGDNWLRCWFNGLDAEEIVRGITTPRSLAEWVEAMEKVFIELYRVTRPGGWVAFEVGEVRGGTVRLEEPVIPLGRASGFECEGVVIQRQAFTKTSNIWGIGNNDRGTNTNRIVLFRKAGVTK